MCFIFKTQPAEKNDVLQKAIVDNIYVSIFQTFKRVPAMTYKFLDVYQTIFPRRTRAFHIKYGHCIFHQTRVFFFFFFIMLPQTHLLAWSVLNNLFRHPKHNATCLYTGRLGATVAGRKDFFFFFWAGGRNFTKNLATSFTLNKLHYLGQLMGNKV